MTTLSSFLTTCTSFYPSARLFALSRVPLHVHLHVHLHATYRILLSPELNPITESCMVIKFSEKEI